jgi:hypothetical protein
VQRSAVIVVHVFALAHVWGVHILGMAAAVAVGSHTMLTQGLVLVRAAPITLVKQVCSFKGRLTDLCSVHVAWCMHAARRRHGFGSCSMLIAQQAAWLGGLLLL